MGDGVQEGRGTRGKGYEGEGVQEERDEEEAMVEVLVLERRSPPPALRPTLICGPESLNYKTSPFIITTVQDSLHANDNTCISEHTIANLISVEFAKISI